MRWFIAAILALISAWALYLASPYWALYRLGAAIEARDAAEIVERINVRALRVSLARQLAADLSGSIGGGLSSADAQTAAAAALALANPLLDRWTGPSGIADLLLSGPSGLADGAVFGGDPVSYEDLDDFLAASSWRGFRSVYVTLPPGEPVATRYRLQLRFGRLRWRLVSLELPPEVRKRIADALARGQLK